MSPRKRLEEGAPLVAGTMSAALHERDYFIHGALSSASDAWLTNPNGKFLLSPTDVADRAVLIANAVMERRESA